MAELRLIYGFTALVLFVMGISAEPALLARFGGWVAPGLPRQVRRELKPVAALAQAEKEITSIPPVMLRAATRWYVGLQLPRTRLELWSGPPLSERQRHVDPEGEPING